MNLGKGLLFSVLGCAMACGAWYSVINWSGWSLWLLAPFVGLAAGVGMAVGGCTKKDTGGKILAAMVALAGVCTVRYLVITNAVGEYLEVTSADAVDHLAGKVAEELEASGANDVYDSEGDYSGAVYARAEREWERMSVSEQSAYLANVQEEVSTATAFMTPLAIVIDFGIFGTLWTIGAAFVASKTASSGKPSEADDETEEEVLTGPLAAARRAELPTQSRGLPGMPPPSVGGLPGMPPPSGTGLRFATDDEPARPAQQVQRPRQGGQDRAAA